MAPVRRPGVMIADPHDADAIAAAAASVLPPSLAPAFDARFTHADRRFDEYVTRLAQQVVRETRIDRALETWGSADEIVERAKLDPRCAVVPVEWMLRRLAERGAVAVEVGADGRRRFRAGGIAAPNPREVREAQERDDAGALPSYELAEIAAQAYPSFLEGTRTGEELLLAPARLRLWRGYFDEQNVLYQVNNRVGAVGLATWLPSGSATILELGAGMGSGTAAALAALREADRLKDVKAYRATDVVPLFLRYAEQRVPKGAVAGIVFERLDMNRPFAEQGVPPGSVSVVYAVNVLHVADDLGTTLDEVRRALAPGGQVIFAECVRPRADQTLYPEFVFNMLATFRAPRLHPRYRPNGGFLTPEQWRDALDAVAFVDVRMLPDVPAIRDVVPHFSVAAIAGTRAA